MRQFNGEQSHISAAELGELLSALDGTSTLNAEEMSSLNSILAVKVSGTLPALGDSSPSDDVNPSGNLQRRLLVEVVSSLFQAQIH